MLFACRWPCLVLAGLLVASHANAADYVPRRTGVDFPLYTNKPPGKQITSNQLPATTPALSPEETRKKNPCAAWL